MKDLFRTYRNYRPHPGPEYQLQEATSRYLAYLPAFRGKPYFHVANERGQKLKNGAIKVARLKRQGMRPGVSDWIFLFPSPSESYASAAIELKVKAGRINQNQKDFLNDVAQAGGFAAVCYSLEDFEKAVSDFMNGQPIQTK